ncbi:MAG: exopolysaccharide biosynthesis protein [Clostridia bacterium]|nr:exopolysaccharide biosynthesis protein [Clostridia bacterium]
MIPKTIHYCWFGKKDLPPEAKRCIASWKKICPDYDIIRWDENNFDVNQNPFIKAAYETKKWAFVSDYARLKVVYDNGGIYLDTDVELRKNLDSLREHGCYIGIQQNEFLCNTGLGFGATKSNPVVLKMLESYDDLTFSESHTLELSCPRLNNAVIRSYGLVSNTEITDLPEVTVYPPQYFDPYGGKNLLCDETYSIHHYAASWTSEKNQFKRKIARWIGQDNIISIKSLLKIR